MFDYLVSIVKYADFCDFLPSSPRPTSGQRLSNFLGILLNSPLSLNKEERDGPYLRVVIISEGTNGTNPVLHHIFAL
jgi:hypothetical protein